MLDPQQVDQVRQAVDSWPPLTTEQRDAIATIFAGAVSSD